MTNDDILRLVAEKLGNPLLFEDLKGDFAIHTEASDWINFARALLASKPVVPQGFAVKRVEGHGWIIDPPSGSRWIAYEGTPAGELMEALVTAPAQPCGEPCEADEYSSRVCERGTLSCDVEHSRTAQPIGEDAANGAMTAAYEAWLRQERARRADFNSLAASWARSAWKACASLTAEKVAGQDQSWLPVINREFLGRVVREAWVKWAQQQPNPKPSWLVPYDELSEPDKEADRQIGEAVTQWVLSIKSATWEVATAPQQPAQSAEQDERAAFVPYYEGVEICQKCKATRAASTQSTATRTHTTQPGESVMGIALRQCGDENEWRHILACNPKFADLLPSDYFPVGTVLTLPPVATATQPVQKSGESQ